MVFCAVLREKNSATVAGQTVLTFFVRNDVMSHRDTLLLRNVYHVHFLDRLRTKYLTQLEGGTTE
jgi:hypothetical protein